MRIGRKTKIGTIVITLLSPALLGVFAPSSAGTPTASPLIDKDFEVALRKFVSRRFFNRIDATAEQQEKLSRIMADTQDETRPLREELRQGMVELASLMADDKSTDEQIKTRAVELRQLHEKVQDRRLSAVLEARKVLTPEQRQQINSRINELITGGIKHRRISMLMQVPGSALLGD